MCKFTSIESFHDNIIIFSLIDMGMIVTQASLATGYKRPEWRYKLPPSASASQTGSEGGKRVRFNRPTTRASTKATKTKSQSMLDAVRRTLEEEKWKERIQQKVVNVYITFSAIALKLE